MGFQSLRSSIKALALFPGLLALSLNVAPGSAQTPRGNSTSVKCSIEVETKSWSRGNPATVLVKIENVSDGDLKFFASYDFHLTGQSKEALARTYSVRGDNYWAPAGITNQTGGWVLVPNGLKDAIRVDRTHGRIPNEEVSLSKGATLEFNIDLTKFSWADQMSSMWPDNELVKQVPSGKYLLSFEINGKEVKTSSNSIEVNIL